MKKLIILSALLLLTACSNEPLANQTGSTSNPATPSAIITNDNGSTTPEAMYSTATPTASPSEKLPQPLSPEQNLADFEKTAGLLNITSLQDCERVPANLTAVCQQKFQPASTEETQSPRPPIAAPTRESEAQSTGDSAVAPQ